MTKSNAAVIAEALKSGRKVVETTEQTAMRLIVNLLSCRNAMQRVTFCQLTLPAEQDLVIAADWLMEQGFLKVEGTRSAYLSRYQENAVMYLTKSGRAWYRANEAAYNEWKWRAPKSFYAVDAAA